MSCILVIQGGMLNGLFLMVRLLIGEDDLMSYFMNNIMGESIDEPDEEGIREVLAELWDADSEHFDVSLVHESGWSLSVYPDKNLVWENVNEDEVRPRDLTLDSWQGVVDVLLKLSRGEISTLNSLDWHES